MFHVSRMESTEKKKYEKISLQERLILLIFFSENLNDIEI